MQNLLLWGNTSSSKRFLFSVTCTFFSVAAMSWGATEENDDCLHIHLDAANNTQTRNAQR